MDETKSKSAKILIVDDQQPNIDLLEGFLEMEGYEHVKSTNDPRNVFSLYESFTPDLILLDLAMPYLTGFDVMDKWKKGPPDYTKEDAQKLKERGYPNTDMPYNDKDLTEVDPDKYYGNHGTGNPYHDSEGKFCSADQSVTTGWS